MKETFTIKRNGHNIQYEIVKICNYENNNYLIYKEKDDVEYFASKYEVVNNKLILDEINDDEVWDYLDKELSNCYE